MHFFIDPTKLTTQIAADQYGPEPANPTLKYNITSQFQLSETTDAYACEKSLMIVQQSEAHSSLVNIILKPVYKRSGVDYYIYRGILKSSLINGESIVSKDPTNNDLIARIYRTFTDDSYIAGILGFDNSIFLSTDPVESVFNASRNTVKPITVLEGEAIGTFTNAPYKIGIEVIIDTDKIKLTLDFVRKSKTVIDITGLGIVDARCKREEILCFIDPIAFFGFYFFEGINYWDTSSSSKLLRKSTSVPTPAGQAIDNYFSTKLASKFATRNRVYLDIRNERGYSYNFYGNYKDTTDLDKNIKIGYGSGSLTSGFYSTNSLYANSNWPIVIFESPQSTTQVKTRLKIGLRIDDNTIPLVFTNKKQHRTLLAKPTPAQLTDISTFVTNKDLVNGTSMWGNDFSFYFPNEGANNTGGTRNNVAYYIRAYYFKQAYNAGAPNVVLQNQYYFDSAFCPVDHPGLLTLPTSSDGFVGNDTFNFVRQDLDPVDGTGNFGYVATNGAYWDQTRVLFYSTRHEAFKTSGKAFIKPVDSRKLTLNSRFNSSHLRRNLDTICRSYTYTEVTPSETLKILGINYYANGTTFKEDLLLLGLSVDEVNAIRTLAGFNNNHHKYIYLELVGARWDNGVANSNRFYEYRVRVQGLDVNGLRTILTPQLNSNEIRVFTRDKYMFASRSFVQNEVVVPDAVNEIEYHVFHNGTVRINDNIDLSLLHSTGTTVLFKRLYYKYHRQGQTNPDDICNLEVRQIDKLKNGVTFNTGLPVNDPVTDAEPTPGWISTINYLPFNVSAHTSYLYANGNIITRGDKYESADYKIIYRNDNKKAFIVRMINLDLTIPLNIQFYFNGNSRRFFASPSVAAALIGALVDYCAHEDTATTVVHQILCNGFGYEDGSAFPSVNHNNGQAIDTQYHNAVAGLTNAQRLARDQAFVNGMDKFGFETILRGLNSHYSAGLTIATNGGQLHNSHLHCQDLILNQ
jgi:hypothetical protein